MSARYYDVVILGADLAPLSCAALLAKRGFRVLLLGQDDPDPSYSIDTLRLPQRPFHHAFGHTPVSQRVITELGLGPTLRRPSRSSEPPFQVAIPGHRFDVSHDDAELLATFEREFPEVRRPIEDFHKLVQRVMQAVDGVFARDLVIPPESFLERQRFASARRAMVPVRLAEGEDLLSEFPEGHRFRSLVSLPARFEANSDPAQLSPLLLMRLYGNCRRGSIPLEGGMTGLRELFVQKIQAHSGQLRFDERAAEIVVQRGEATGLRLAQSGDEIACGFVVAGVDIAALARWLPDRGALESLFERVGEPMVRYYRYTLNVVLKRAGMPPGLGRNLYFASGPGASGSQELHITSQNLDDARSLLCAQTLLPARKVEDDPEYMAKVRDTQLEALKELLPFLSEHLLLVDSPHDGRPPDGQHTPLNPFARARRGPRSMRPLYSYPVQSHLGLCALPIRTPIKRLLLCNGQVLPGLGSEGQLLAACSAARVITWADRSRPWMRRPLWAKIET